MTPGLSKHCSIITATSGTLLWLISQNSCNYQQCWIILPTYLSSLNVSKQFVTKFNFRGMFILKSQVGSMYTSLIFFLKDNKKEEKENKFKWSGKSASLPQQVTSQQSEFDSHCWLVFVWFFNFLCCCCNCGITRMCAVLLS